MSVFTPVQFDFVCKISSYAVPTAKLSLTCGRRCGIPIQLQRDLTMTLIWKPECSEQLQLERHQRLPRVEKTSEEKKRPCLLYEEIDALQ